MQSIPIANLIIDVTVQFNLRQCLLHQPGEKRNLTGEKRNLTAIQCETQFNAKNAI